MLLPSSNIGEVVVHCAQAGNAAAHGGAAGVLAARLSVATASLMCRQRETAGATDTGVRVKRAASGRKPLKIPPMTQTRRNMLASSPLALWRSCAFLINRWHAQPGADSLAFSSKLLFRLGIASGSFCRASPRICAGVAGEVGRI